MDTRPITRKKNAGGICWIWGPFKSLNDEGKNQEKRWGYRDKFDKEDIQYRITEGGGYKYVS